jgi:hypothetical protein
MLDALGGASLSSNVRRKATHMKLGYAYFRSNLIKLGILSVAMPFILWDYFTGKDTKSELGAIYLIIAIWIGGAAFLTWQMIRAKRRERAVDHTQIAEPVCGDEPPPR